MAGRYLRYPETDVERIAEGGLRLKGQYKHNLPGKPLVSIITVCWNSDATIRQTIDSVMAQTYDNVEFIVVDGKSSDRTVDILAEYEDRIDYYVSESDKGLYYAMNKGIELSAGKFILILNSDDWYREDCVEVLQKAQQRTGADHVSALTQYVDGDGKLLHVMRSVPLDDGVRIRMPLRHETMYVPARIYDEMGGYNENYRIIADFRLTVKMFETGYSHYEVQEPLLYFRNTGCSSESNLGALFAERENILSELFPYLMTSEVKLLAEFGKITQDQLLAMYNKYYGNDKFIRSIRCWIDDQVKNGNRKWLGMMSRFREVEAKHKHINFNNGSYSTKKSDDDVLRIGTFCSHDTGGAGIGTQRRVAALRKAGVDAQILSLSVKTDHAYVRRIVPRFPGLESHTQDRIWQEVCRAAVTPVRKLEGYCASELFSLAEGVVNYDDMAPLFNEFDVIHFHWVLGLFDYERAAVELGNRPMVWTLADMNAFTGGCHYSEGCEGYKQECHHCPLLGGDNDMAHEQWVKKKRAYDQMHNLTIICPSRWMARKVKESSLLGDKDIRYIPNAFPIYLFKPTNKMVARVRLGLPMDKKLLLFGADNVKNKRKGGEELVKAVNRLVADNKHENVEIITFGSNALELPVPSHAMGNVTDEERLALIYSAADGFVFSSLEDNAPLTVGESMLCGTPVISYPTGNVPDLLEHRVTGYIAEYMNPDDLAMGIEWLLDMHPEDALQASVACRKAAQNIHDPELAAKRHIDLYREILDR